MSLESFFGAVRINTTQYASVTGGWEQVLPANTRRIFIMQLDGFELWPSIGGQPNFTPLSPHGIVNTDGLSFHIHGPVTMAEWWQFTGVVGGISAWVETILLTDPCKHNLPRVPDDELTQIDWTTDMTSSPPSGKPLAPPSTTPDISQIPIAAATSVLRKPLVNAGLSRQLMQVSPGVQAANAAVASLPQPVASVASTPPPQITYAAHPQIPGPINIVAGPTVSRSSQTSATDVANAYQQIMGKYQLGTPEFTNALNAILRGQTP